MADFEKVYSIKFDVSKADKALDKLEDALKKIEKSGVFFQMQAISRVLKEIDKHANQASKTIRDKLGRDARRDLNALGKSGKQAAADLDRIPQAAKRVDISLSAIGRNMNRYILAPLAAMSGLSIKAALDMNKGMANVSTLIDATPAKLQEMKREAQDTMVAMGKGTQDVTDGLYQVISALGQSEQNMQQLHGATKAAVAGLSDTKSSVEMLTAVAKAYNDTSAKSIEHTSDLAFQTVKLGVTTFPELAASIGKVAPLAAQFNTSQEELFGTMATLTGVTGSTAEVVTQLASAYAAFMKPSEEMENAVKRINKANKDYNFESAGAMLKTIGYKKSIELLGEAAGGSEEKLFEMFRRKEAILGILPLISSQSENYTKKVNAMRDAAGATDEAFRKQTEGINKQGFELERTKQRIVVFGQRIGDRLIPMLGRAVEFGNRMLDWIDSMDESSIEAAISIGKVVGQFVLFTNALRGINAVSSGIMSFLGSASGEFASFGGSVLGATGKVGAFNRSLLGLQKGLAVIGLIGAGYTLEELIRKGLIEPGMAAHEKKMTGIGNRAIEERLNVSDVETVMDAEQKQRQLERDRAERAKEENKWLYVGFGKRTKETEQDPSNWAWYDEQAEADKQRDLTAIDEAIGSLERQKSKITSGIAGLERYNERQVEQSGARTNFFDADIVRQSQVPRSEDPELSRTIVPGGFSGSNISITTNVNMESKVSDEQLRRQADAALARKLREARNQAGQR